MAKCTKEDGQFTDLVSMVAYCESISFVDGNVTIQMKFVLRAASYSWNDDLHNARYEQPKLLLNQDIPEGDIVRILHDGMTELQMRSRKTVAKFVKDSKIVVTT